MSSELDARIAAVAHLSQAWAFVTYAYEALDEAGVERPDRAIHAGPVVNPLSFIADEILEPYGVSNVLRTVEEVLAEGHAFVPGTRVGISVSSNNVDRGSIVRAILGARRAAREDGVVA